MLVATRGAFSDLALVALMFMVDGACTLFFIFFGFVSRGNKIFLHFSLNTQLSSKREMMHMGPINFKPISHISHTYEMSNTCFRRR